VEKVYNLPGLGSVAVRALQRQDLPTILGVVVWTTLGILVINLLVDLVYAWVDPRVRVVEQRSTAPVLTRARAPGAREAPLAEPSR
jgi:ABC-type microcin C transport system permease subunit YejB